MPKLLLACYNLLNLIVMTYQLTDCYEVPPTTDFQLTGTGTNENWQKTAWMPLLSLNHLKDYETKVKVLYSETGLYVFAFLQDKKIVSTMEEDNANLWEEDVFEVFLQTSEDYPLYFEYEISPRGYELPILVPHLKNDYNGWLPWNYEGDRKIIKQVHQAEGFWSAEIFIPYKLLAPLQNVPPVRGTFWKANFYRLDYDTGKGERFAWQPIETNFHQYQKFGTLIFK